MKYSELHLKYRPSTFEEVVGHDDVIDSLLSALYIIDGPPHAYLFTGNSGTGKTTLARIVAKEIGCPKMNILEYDAAYYSKVEDMRELISALTIPSPDGKPRAVIIDEFHAATKSAMQSVLKFIEEPPKHLYFMLCSTEESKILPTIKARCHHYRLKPISTQVIESVIEDIVVREKLKIDDSIIPLCAKEAHGSMRQALIYLSMVADCENSKDAARVIGSIVEGSEIREVCQILLKGSGSKSFEKLVKTVSKLEEPPMTIRYTILSYFSTVLEKNPLSVQSLAVLDAFNNTLVDFNHKSAIYTAGARVLLEG